MPTSLSTVSAGSELVVLEREGLRVEIVLRPFAFTVRRAASGCSGPAGTGARTSGSQGSARGVRLDLDPRSWEFNPHQFPDASGMVEMMREDGVRAVLWVTPWINLDSRDGQIPPQPESERRHREPAPNYAPAAAAGHFVKEPSGEPLVTRRERGRDSGASEPDPGLGARGSVVGSYPARHVARGLGDVPESERPLEATLWGSPRLAHTAGRLADGTRIAWRRGVWSLRGAAATREVSFRSVGV